MNRLWEEYILGRPEVEIPSQVLKYTELVLDANRNLVERKRLPGENDVCILSLMTEISHFLNYLLLMLLPNN